MTDHDAGGGGKNGDFWMTPKLSQINLYKLLTHYDIWLKKTL